MKRRVLFRITTPLGSSIRTTESYWQLIQTKHPEIKGMLALVKNTLALPDFITISRIDKSVFLFYRKINSYWLCAVTKCTGIEGFLITTYITDKIKEGEKVWPD